MKLGAAIFVISLVTFNCVGQAADIGVNEICRAAIGVLMQHDPSTIKTDKFDQGISYLSYVRPDDGTLWTYRCKVLGNQVNWASDVGRWRTDMLDEQLTYELDQDRQNLKIKLTFTDGSSVGNSYPSSIF